VINLVGPMLSADNKTLRDCQLTLTLLAPATRPVQVPPPENKPSAKSAPGPQPSTKTATPAATTTPATPGPGDEWTAWRGSIPVQETQFCRVINNFNEGMDKARKDQNDTAKDEVYKRALEDLKNLTQNGSFEGWIFKYDSVSMGKSDAAIVRFQPPCKLIEPCDSQDTSFQGTMSKELQYFRELPKLERGSFLLVSGNITEIEHPITPDSGQYCNPADLFSVEFQSVFKLVAPPR
jgi:hypothetical protein